MSEQRNPVFGEQRTTEQRIKLMSGGHLPTLKQFRKGEIRSKKHVGCLNEFFLDQN